MSVRSNVLTMLLTIIPVYVATEEDHDCDCSTIVSLHEQSILQEPIWTGCACSVWPSISANLLPMYLMYQRITFAERKNQHNNYVICGVIPCSICPRLQWFFVELESICIEGLSRVWYQFVARAWLNLCQCELSLAALASSGEVHCVFWTNLDVIWKVCIWLPSTSRAQRLQLIFGIQVTQRPIYVLVWKA